MFPSDETLIWMYALCDKDDDCERGTDHEGECGQCQCNEPHQGSCASARSAL